MIDHKKQGKRNRQAGAVFERRVRDDLETKGWFVSKFQSNVELTLIGSEGKIKYDPSMLKQTTFIAIEGKLIQAKSSRFRLQSTGFPDFICWKKNRYIIKIKKDKLSMNEINNLQAKLSTMKPSQHIISATDDVEIIPDYEIIGVEAKTNGYLDKTEKAKCKWLLDNKIFSSILIAKKTKVGRKVVVEYKEFKEK